jgi:hypothetical protein
MSKKYNFVENPYFYNRPFNSKDEFSNYIGDVLKKLFINLNIKDLNLIQTLVCFVINIIGIKFGFRKRKRENLIKQFKQNNNRDIYAVVNIILPYIDDKNNFELFKELKSFQQLYTGKINKNEKRKDINNYKFCNIQFNRVRRNLDKDIGTINKDYKLEEIKFNEKHLIDSVIFISSTIEQVANKLYVNWLNVRPIGINFKESNVYKRSFKFDEENDYFYFDTFGNKEKLDWWRIDQEFEPDVSSIYKFYDGLFIGDIYNTIINDYYLSIKSIKWMIFEYKIDSKLDNKSNYKIESLIFIFDKLLPIENMINNRNWYDLDEKEQLEYDNKWSGFKKLINNKSNFNNYKFNILEKIFLNFISFFDSNYLNLEEAIKEGEYLPIENRSYDDDDSEKEILYKINLEEAEQAVEKLSSKHIYQYVFECINKFKTTIYYDKIFKEKNILVNEESNWFLTPKNFYNFSKSVYIKNNTSKFNRLWSSLSSDDRDEFCNRLNTNSEEQEWFNIIINLKDRLYLYNLNDAKEHNKLIYKEIRKRLIDNVFSSLTKKGILSEFIYQPDLTDEKITSDVYEKKKKIIKDNLEKLLIKDLDNKKKYENSYYFITKDLYKNLKPIYKKIAKNKEKKIKFFKNLIDNERWYTFYAMDWMCQIMFFNNFINNRVIYVTGSTGQGKSTQVPKLTMYALMMVEYKNGKIICTQPRIDPTVQNAETISSQLGVPIKKYSKTYEKDVSAIESYVQFKHSGDEHTSTTVPHYLRLQTDGSFFETLSKNIILKEKHKDNSTNEINKYSLNNIYDVVMIDEAHEHNSYMDIILTLMRNCITYNNSIKLFIISATIDADEPNYRRYFRDINDNLAYPLNMINLSYDIDRINIDRRFHISPPGKTTQFKVLDIYDNLSKDTDIDNEKNGINKVYDIIKSSSTGDILFFSFTVAKIKNICKILNNNLPNYVIAIPFYAQMLNKYKSLVGKIDTKIKELNIHKDDIIDVFEGNKSLDEAKKVDMGLYTRAVIIATNVAEASITIQSLKYVIDLGYQLNVSYDYKDAMSKPSITKITESSRVQRRGRVGRTQDGTVYYMYKENSRKNIKQLYNICAENLTNKIYSLLTNNYIDISFLKKNDNIHLNDNEIDFQKTNDILNRISIYNRTGYDKILKEQFIRDDLLFNENVLYDKKFLKKDNYDYDFPLKFIAPLFSQYGFYHDTIVDTEGLFYIIHPYENEIKRELLTGRIIYDPLSTDKNKTYTKINPTKINHFFKKLEFEKKIFDLDYVKNKNFHTKNITTLKLNKKIIKTNYGLELEKINREINNFEFDIIPYVYSRKYICKYEVLVIISFLKNIDNGLSDWYPKIKNKYDKDGIKSFKKIHGNDNSDFLTLLNIFNNFKSSFSKLKIFNKKYYTLHKKKNNNFLFDLKEFKKIDNNIFDKKILTNLSDDKYNRFLKYKRKNQLNKKDSEIDYISNNIIIKKEIFDEIENNNDILKWCKLNFINYNTLIDRFKIYYKNIVSVKYYDETNYKEMNKFSNNKIVKIYDNIDKYTLINNVSNNQEINIIKSFLHKNKENISYKINFDEYEITNVKKNKNLSKLIPFNKNYLQTTIKPIDWVYYYSVDSKDGLQMLSNIKPKWIIEIAPEIYNPVELSSLNNPSTIELINNFDIADLQYLIKNNDNKNLLDKRKLLDINKLIYKIKKKEIKDYNYKKKIKILNQEKLKIIDQINIIDNQENINNNKKMNIKINKQLKKINDKINKLEKNYISKEDYDSALKSLNTEINLIKKNNEFDFYNKLFSFINNKIINNQLGGNLKNIKHSYNIKEIMTKKMIIQNYGFYNNNSDFLIKIKIDKLKKTKKIMNLVSKEKYSIIDRYDYCYLHFQLQNLSGIHLIRKNKNKNVITVNVLYKTNNSTIDFIESHIYKKGYSVITLL